MDEHSFQTNGSGKNKLMAASPRNTVKLLYQKLQDQSKSDPGLRFGKERELLEYLVFAAFLENTAIKSAETAFDQLEDYFIDWNEIRVSTTAELVDVLTVLPYAQRAAERLRRTLQWIFETTYKFDLEDWRKKDVKEFQAFLASNPFSTHFMNDFVLHFAMNQPPIPFDEGAMRILRLLDLVEIDAENKEQVRGVERTFSRQDADCFFTLLHQTGSDIMRDPETKKIKKLLKSIDPESETRSWISLVETDMDIDPAVIARTVASKQIKRPKPPILLDIDDELLDESLEVEFMVEGEEGDLIAQTPFDAEDGDLAPRVESEEECGKKQKEKVKEGPKKSASGEKSKSKPFTAPEKEPVKKAPKAEKQKTAAPKEKKAAFEPEKKGKSKAEPKAEKKIEKKPEVKSAKPSKPSAKSSAKPTAKQPQKSAPQTVKKSTPAKKAAPAKKTAMKKTLPPPDPPAKENKSKRSHKKK